MFISVNQYALYSPIFSQLHSIINGEQHEKYLYNKFSHYGKYKNFNCEDTRPSFWFKSGCVAWSQSITILCLRLLWPLWVTFQVKDSVRSAPASTTLTQVSHWSDDVCNHHLRGKGERNGAQRRTKVSHDASIGATAIGEKAPLGVKWNWLVKKSSLY